MLNHAVQVHPNRKLDRSELVERYFDMATRAQHLWERWMLTESDEVFREWQFASKQAAQLRVTINNRVEVEIDTREF